MHNVPLDKKNKIFKYGNRLIIAKTEVINQHIQTSHNVKDFPLYAQQHNIGFLVEEGISSLETVIKATADASINYNTTKNEEKLQNVLDVLGFDPKTGIYQLNKLSLSDVIRPVLEKPLIVSEQYGIIPLLWETTLNASGTQSTETIVSNLGIPKDWVSTEIITRRVESELTNVFLEKEKYIKQIYNDSGLSYSSSSVEEEKR